MTWQKDRSRKVPIFLGTHFLNHWFSLELSHVFFDNVFLNLNEKYFQRPHIGRIFAISGFRVVLRLAGGTFRNILVIVWRRHGSDS